MNKIILHLLLFILPVSAICQVTNIKDAPEVQVKIITSKPTAFPDSMYAKMDWKSFSEFAPAQKTIDYLDIDYGLLNAAIFYYTNKYRESLKLNQLTFMPELRDAAIYHSLEMTNRKFYNHMNPYNKHMYTPKDRIVYFKFNGQAMGENIDYQFLMDYNPLKPFWAEADGQHFKYHYGNNVDNKGEIKPETYCQFAEKMVEAWIESPPHRENLQNKLFKFLGCGVIGDFRTGKQSVIPQAYGTQDFGG